MPAPVPPLAGEDHVCATCGISYVAVSVDTAIEKVGSIAERVRAAVEVVGPAARSVRPDESTWSVTEYVCHLRDVYVTYTIRLHRARTEDRPVLEPMLNDLRARRFGYNGWDVAATLDELTATAAGFCAEARRLGADDGDRVVTRLPGEERTARWLVRQAMHEGEHHLADIRRIAAAVTG